MLSIGLIIGYLLIRLCIYPILRLINNRLYIQKVYRMYPYEKYLQIYQKYQRSEKAFEDELEIWNFCQKHQELDGYHGYLEFIKLKTNSVAYQKLTLNKIDGAIIILLLIVSLY